MKETSNLLSFSWFYGSLYDSSIMEVASSNCESAAGHLTTIRNAFENSEFVEISRGYHHSQPKKVLFLDFFGQSAFYEIPIGYHSSGAGVWSWDDHTNSTYTNWALARMYFRHLPKYRVQSPCYPLILAPSSNL